MKGRCALRLLPLSFQLNHQIPINTKMIAMKGVKSSIGISAGAGLYVGANVTSYGVIQADITAVSTVGLKQEITSFMMCRRRRTTC